MTSGKRGAIESSLIMSMRGGARPDIGRNSEFTSLQGNPVIEFGGKMKIGIKDIILDDDIYPRIRKSQQTIDQYAESLRAGANFPSIEVQKISVDGKAQIIILDGLHRLGAYQKVHEQPELGGNLVDFSQIESHFWKDEVLDKKENLNLLRMRSASLNSQHGDRMTNADYKALAEKIANDDPEYKISSETIAKEWGLCPRTVRDWIQSIRAKQKAKRDRIIFKLSMLGWSTREIAEVTGIGKSQVSELSSNGEIAKIGQSISDWLTQGKTVEEAAAKLEIDATLVWAIHLQGKSDEQRAEALNIDIKKFSTWNYTSAHPLMGNSSFQGRIPGEIPFNIIHWFSKSDALVIDSMAGSGTTLDAALLLGRKCRGYDINPSRQEIEKADTVQEIPCSKKADLIFVNPPYWKAVDYDCPLCNCTLDEFFDGMKNLAQNCYSVLKDDGFFAFMMGNQSTKIDECYQPTLNLIDPIKQGIKEVGFKWYIDILCPYPTEGAQNWAQAKWDKGYLADLKREVMVFKK